MVGGAGGQHLRDHFTVAVHALHLVERAFVGLHAKPVHAVRIACTASGVERSTSVSSMRSTKVPWWWRAKAHENSAVRAPPRCRKPVGEGAKRVRMGRKRWRS